MPVIEAKDITFGYEKQPIFDRLNVAIERGEFVGLVGPNGSGKTTFLNLLTRVLKPSSGRIVIDGVDIHSISARQLARKVAVVPQESTFIFPFTVREIVLMGRAPHLRSILEKDEDFSIAEDAMEAIGIAHLADRPITQLSGGERQGVIIARALAQMPEILLLDEPTAFLDIRHQVGIYDILTRLNLELKMTIVAVSHDLNLAAHYCERILVFKRGELKYDGEPYAAITPAIVREVYETDVIVRRDEQTGRPFVLPVHPQNDSESGGGT